MNTFSKKLFLYICILCSGSVFSAEEVQYGRIDANLQKGIMLTLDMVEADAAKNQHPWVTLIPLIRHGVTGALSEADILLLKDCVYHLPAGAPALLGDLASMAWFNQSNNYDDLIKRLESGNDRLVATALTTADIAPYNSAYRDAIYEVVVKHVAEPILSSTAPMHFALRNYNNPPDTYSLRELLREKPLSSTMRQMLFESLIFIAPGQPANLDKGWVTDLFLSEVDINTFKMMMIYLNQSDLFSSSA